MMRHAISTTRRALLAALLGLAVSACAAHGTAWAPPAARAGLVQLDVYDRTSGSALAVYAKDGRRYIVGTPGHEYALRIRNTTGGRVLVVTSVDGVNVITGDTAATSQSGYVLDAYGSVEIIGWRKSLERTAAFFFTDLGNSYAARTGRPNDVGVIGVAAFREKVTMLSRREAAVARGEAAPEAKSAAPASGVEMPAEAAAPNLDDLSREDRSMPAQPPSTKLGTGHGRSEPSRVTLVRFERASETPAQTLTIQYDRRDNLAAMGVLPAPYYSRREPQPFPGSARFVPDP